MRSSLAPIEMLAASVAPATDCASVVRFPYAAQIRNLVEKDRILEARKLLDFALRNSRLDPALEGWRRALAPPRVIRRQPVANGTERTEEFRWFERESHAFRGRWVAVERDQLVAQAATLKDLMAILRSIEPTPHPIVHQVE